jgi:hypothetical protein
VSASVRAWLAAALAGLLVASALHLAALAGLGAAWGAMVHATLFGWISAMIVAVSYHTVPVFSGRDYPYAWVAWAHLAFAGSGALLAALSVFAAPLLLAGIALELIGALLYTANTVLLFTRGARRGGCPVRPPIPQLPDTDRVGTEATKAAGLCLPLSLALMLAARAGLPGAEWWLAAEHIAAAGWVLLTIAGVAYHVLPRFSGLPLRGAGWARAQLGCHLLALALVVPGLGLGLRGVFAAGGALLALACALLAYTVWPTLRPLRLPAGAMKLEVGR